MLASELIKQLQEKIAEHGDLEVLSWGTDRFGYAEHTGETRLEVLDENCFLKKKCFFIDAADEY